MLIIKLTDIVLFCGNYCVSTTRCSSYILLSRIEYKMQSCTTPSYITTDDSDADAHHSIQAARTYRRQNTRTDKVVVYWVSYLDGVQRVLLLSQDESIAKKAVKVSGWN